MFARLGSSFRRFGFKLKVAKPKVWQFKRNHRRHWRPTLAWELRCWTTCRPMNGWAVCCARLMQADGKTILNTDKKVIPIGGNETTHMGLSNPHFLWNIVCRLLGTIVALLGTIVANTNIFYWTSQVKSAPTPAGEPNVRAEAEKRKTKIIYWFVLRLKLFTQWCLLLCSSDLQPCHWQKIVCRNLVSCKDKCFGLFDNFNWRDTMVQSEWVRPACQSRQTLQGAGKHNKFNLHFTFIRCQWTIFFLNERKSSNWLIQKKMFWACSRQFPICLCLQSAESSNHMCKYTVQLVERFLGTNSLHAQSIAPLAD